MTTDNTTQLHRPSREKGRLMAPRTAKKAAATASNEEAKINTPAPTPEISDEDRGTAAGRATGASAKEISNAVTRAINGDNTALWDILKRTDPKATKPFQRAGGFRGTQIDPAWRLQMMTEVFGPVGFGWGWEQVEWTIAERMVFICARVWFSDPMDRSVRFYTGPQWGGTEMVRRNRDGTERPDDECFKMSMTDAIGKCFLQLGLAADIYLGQFDDSKYQEESTTIYKVKETGWSELAIKRFEREVATALLEVTSLDDLDDYWRSGINAKIREIGTVDKAAQNRMITAFSQKKNEILTREEGGMPYDSQEDDRDPPPEDDRDEGDDQQEEDKGQEAEDEPPPPAEQAQQQEQQQPEPPAQQQEEAQTDDQPAGKIPPPVTIALPEKDGKPDWARWGKMAMADLQKAIDDDYGSKWLEAGKAANSVKINDMTAFNAAWAKKVTDAYKAAMDYFTIQAEQAREEASREFPTIPVEWLGNPEDGGTQDWIKFERDVLGYSRRMPRAAIAADWLGRQSITIKALRGAGQINDKGYTGEQAAAGIDAALFGRFPQLRK